MEEKDSRVYNHPARNEYRDCILEYIRRQSEKTAARRDELWKLDEPERRRMFRELLGEPLVSPAPAEPVGFSGEIIAETEQYTAERCRLEVMPGFYFGGILYRPHELRDKNALIFALHGGDGTPEVVGGLFMDSANYNRMVERVLRPGTLVFAPQFLLWKERIFGSPYDREGINRRLVQLGGSITALEMFCLSRCVDYFMTRADVDTSRIGIIGLSYGGMYSLCAGALDTRFKAVYSSCSFNDRAKYHWHDWIYKNQENEFFDAEVAALVLPRDLFIEVATHDEVFPAADAAGEAERLRAYAQARGLSDRLNFKVFEGNHELDPDNHMLNRFLTVLELEPIR